MSISNEELLAGEVERLQGKLDKQRTSNLAALQAEIAALRADLAKMKALADSYCAEVGKSHEDLAEANHCLLGALQLRAEAESALAEAQRELVEGHSQLDARGVAMMDPRNIGRRFEALAMAMVRANDEERARYIARAEAAEREVAALKAQGACETCASHVADKAYPGGLCSLRELEDYTEGQWVPCHILGNRCGRWTPVAPTPEG